MERGDARGKARDAEMGVVFSSQATFGLVFQKRLTGIEVVNGLRRSDYRRDAGFGSPRQCLPVVQTLFYPKSCERKGSPPPPILFG